MKKLSIVYSCILIYIATILSFSTLNAQEYPVICPINPPHGPNFDFQAESFECYLSHNASKTYIQNPFHAFGISNGNIAPFATNIIKDYATEDGWTYVVHSFGRPNEYVEQPWIILYNKFSGVLRVFIAVTNIFDQYNNVLLQLSFFDGATKTALLENMSPEIFRKPLKVFNAGFVPGTMANDEFANSLPYWTFADFSLNYDPCTCMDRSVLSIRLILEKIFTTTIVVNGQVVTFGPDAIRAGTNPNILSIGKESYPKIGKILREIAETSKIVKGLNSTESQGNVADSYELHKFLNPLIEQVNLIAPGVSTIINYSTFAAGLYKKSQPYKPVSLTYLGRLAGERPNYVFAYYQNILITNPGSNTFAVDPKRIPYYNNILGTFTLLEKPVFLVENVYNEVYGESGDSGYDYRCGGSDNNKTRIGLKYDLKYSINPSSQLSIVYLNANYIYKGKFIEGTIPFGCLKEFKPVIKEYGKYYDCFPDRGTQEFLYGNPNDYSDKSGIKVTSVFAAPNGQEYVFTNIYEADEEVVKISRNIENFNDFNSFKTIIPPLECLHFTPPATTGELLAICNSKEYKDRVQSFKDQQDHLIQKRTEKTNFGDLTVFPNPTSGLVTLQLPPSNSTQKSIKIFNTSGKLEREFKSMEVVPFNGSEHRLFLDLPQGIYIIQCEYEDHILTSRISIQK